MSKNKQTKPEPKALTAAQITGREPYDRSVIAPLTASLENSLLACTASIPKMTKGALARHFIAVGLARWQATGKIEVAA